jgi:FKBP-type peptidyl-prolyl cis-trans isomerase
MCERSRFNVTRSTTGKETRMSKRAIALALAAAVLTAGCAASTKESSSSGSSTSTSAKVTTAAPAGGAAEGGKVHKLASGLQYEDTFVGSGKMAEPGMNVSIHYTGTLLTTGEKFDSSLDRGQPLVFQVGDHSMIAGFDEGVRGMRIGGKRKITVPPDMGYGAAGRPPQIPPNSTLVFDLELVDVK